MTMNNVGLERRIAELTPILATIIGQPTYILLAADIGLTIHHGCGGFVCGGFWKIIQEKLPGRFAGPRATIVINHLQFSDDFDDEDERYLLAILAHEAAHVTDMWAGDLPDYPIDTSRFTAIVQNQVAEHPREWHGENLPRWFGHEDRYIRGLCHIMFRMECIGLPVDSYLAFPDDYYDLDRFECYVENLRCEMASRQGEPISEILKSEPPKLFTELWEVDSGPGRAMLLAAGPGI